MCNTISMTTANKYMDAFLPLYLALVGIHLENWVQFGAPQCKKGVGMLEQDQQRTLRLSETREHEI